MLGPVAGGFIVNYFNWRLIFFVNIPVGLLGLYMVYRRLPDYREKKTRPLDIVGLILFSSGIALLSYVLEIFGEHSLDTWEILTLLAISLVLLAGYGLHAARSEFPLLRLALFRVRTFRASVTGSFITRLGVGGVPFLLPLLYQAGLGFTPVQSGLLVAPQAVAAMSLKMLMPRILTRFGYRQVLIANTIALGGMIMLFSTIGIGTPAWLIVVQAFIFGFFTSMQYTSMNTLAYADIAKEQSSGATTIASTVQQMSISFGVACASLITSLFLADSIQASAPMMIHGLHQALLVLGAWTILSALVFTELKRDDGNLVSKQAVKPPAA
jgi:MFS family permease